MFYHPRSIMSPAARRQNLYRCRSHTSFYSSITRYKTPHKIWMGMIVDIVTPYINRDLSRRKSNTEPTQPARHKRSRSLCHDAVSYACAAIPRWDKTQVRAPVRRIEEITLIPPALTSTFIQNSDRRLCPHVFRRIREDYLTFSHVANHYQGSEPVLCHFKHDLQWDRTFRRYHDTCHLIADGMLGCFLNVCERRPEGLQAGRERLG